MNTNENNESSGTDVVKIARKYVLVFLIAALCGYALLSLTRNDGQTLPMFGGKGCAVVMTGSMEPNLPVDALVFVSESEDYEVNDIVVIQDGYTLVVHRIININENVVITKGDANNTEDDPVPISHIKGKVTGYIPGVGAVVRFIKTPFGSLAIIAVVVLLWLLSGRKKSSSENSNAELSNDEMSNEEMRKEIERLKTELSERNGENNA